MHTTAMEASFKKGVPKHISVRLPDQWEDESGEITFSFDEKGKVTLSNIADIHVGDQILSVGKIKIVGTGQQKSFVEKWERQLKPGAKVLIERLVEYKEGYLSKRGNINRTFRKRFFRLLSEQIHGHRHNVLLMYFKDNGSSLPLGKIVLNSPGISVKPNPNHEERFYIYSRNPNRSYNMAASSREERQDDWVAHLRSVLNRILGMRKEGWLNKKGAGGYLGRSTFKPRYFRFGMEYPKVGSEANVFFKYYKNENMTNPVGEIPFRVQTTSIRYDREDEKAFWVVTQGHAREYLLRAKDEEEREVWVDHLRTALQTMKPNVRRSRSRKSTYNPLAMPLPEEVRSSVWFTKYHKSRTQYNELITKRRDKIRRHTITIQDIDARGNVAPANTPAGSLIQTGGLLSATVSRNSIPPSQTHSTINVTRPDSLNLTERISASGNVLDLTDRIPAPGKSGSVDRKDLNLLEVDFNRKSSLPFGPSVSPATSQTTINAALLGGGDSTAFRWDFSHMGIDSDGVFVDQNGKDIGTVGGDDQKVHLLATLKVLLSNTFQWKLFIKSLPPDASITIGVITAEKSLYQIPDVEYGFHSDGEKVEAGSRTKNEGVKKTFLEAVSESGKAIELICDMSKRSLTLTQDGKTISEVSNLPRAVTPAIGLRGSGINVCTEPSGSFTSDLCEFERENESNLATNRPQALYFLNAVVDYLNVYFARSSFFKPKISPPICLLERSRDATLLARILNAWFQGTVDVRALELPLKSGTSEDDVKSEKDIDKKDVKITEKKSAEMTHLHSKNGSLSLYAMHLNHNIVLNSALDAGINIHATPHNMLYPYEDPLVLIDVYWEMVKCHLNAECKTHLLSLLGENKNPDVSGSVENLYAGYITQVLKLEGYRSINEVILPKNRNMLIALVAELIIRSPRTPNATKGPIQKVVKESKGENVDTQKVLKDLLEFCEKKEMITPFLPPAGLCHTGEKSATAFWKAFLNALLVYTTKATPKRFSAELTKIDLEQEQRMMQDWAQSIYSGFSIKKIVQKGTDGIELMKLVDGMKAKESLLDKSKLHMSATAPIARRSNCLYFLSICAEAPFGISVSDLKAEDVADGKRGTVLKLLWRLMESHLFLCLSEVYMQINKIKEEKVAKRLSLETFNKTTLITWSNSIIEEAQRDFGLPEYAVETLDLEAKLSIKSFADNHLSDSVYLMALLWSIDPRIVRWENIRKPNGDMKIKIENAKYVMSIAFKLGGSVFVTASDIAMGRAHKIRFFIGSILALAGAT